MEHRHTGPDRVARLILDRPALDFGPGPELAGRRVMITGAGALGRAVADRCLGQGAAEVVLLDQAIEPLRRALELHGASKRLHPVVARTHERGLMHAVFETRRPDLVVHTAGVADAAISMLNPLEAIRCNVLGTEIVLSAARATGCRRFVMAGHSPGPEGDVVSGSFRLAEAVVCADGAPGEAEPGIVARTGPLVAVPPEGPREAGGPQDAAPWLMPGEAAGLLLAAARHGEAGVVVSAPDVPVLSPSAAEPGAADPGTVRERDGETRPGSQALRTHRPAIGSWTDVEVAVSDLAGAVHALNVTLALEILRRLVIDYADSVAGA